MDRIWLKHYPPGVPAEIDVGEYASIRDVFDESVARFASRPAARGCRASEAARARASR